jgi:hypothetical protein
LDGNVIFSFVLKFEYNLEILEGFKMGRKTKIEELNRMFEEGGCKLVSTEYKCGEPLEYMCSCGSPNVQKISLNSFKAGCRCIECQKTRRDKTMLEKHGVLHLTQDPEKKKKMLVGIMKYVEEKKHTIEELKPMFEAEGCELISTEYIDCKENLDVIFGCGCIGEISWNNFLRGRRCNNLECINKKVKETCIVKFGVESYVQSDEYKDRRKETCLEKYGCEHPQQNDEIHSNSKKSAFSKKEYTFPSGRVVEVQGYEPAAIDILLKTYNENNIETDALNMPEFWYDENSSWHRYFPDLYIKKDNLIIEVKSTWTFKLWFHKNILKRKTVKYNGYNFKFMIFKDEKNLVEF